MQYTLSGLTAGQSYKVTISAESLIGEGPQSNPLTIWAVDLPSAPTLSLVDTGRDFCSVQWTAEPAPENSLITGYKVLIDDGYDGDFSIAYDGSSNPSKLDAIVTLLRPQTIYRLKVTAGNKAGMGAESNVVPCFTVAVPG